ncbi:MAG: glycine--tRNA ligase [Candidatus Verstraetearchaeota archaeon]|nr:glycine--tRNA ligase [Candidatus Verstraetearchaeota archaeon]
MDKYDKVVELCRRRGFFWPSSEIYGGVAGFLDFGPMGTMLKRNIERRWRETFIQSHHGLVYEIETPVVMPARVFEASGHVENFTDVIVECLQCHKRFRADHLILEQAGEIQGIEGMSTKELDELISEKGVRCSECRGPLGKVSRFNLLFRTNIGPYSESVAYLRPEAAQGMFVNFKSIFNAMRERLPMGLAQIGKVARNEISPRQGPIRLREFTIMEVEFFFDPKAPGCTLIDEVSDVRLRLLTEDMVKTKTEEPMEVRVAEALKEGYIKTEWLAYFMALSTRFISELGAPTASQMFVAKLPDERAHYSAQTFDQLVRLDRWGWVEVSGHAYRTDYDLSRHIQYSGQDLSAFRKFQTPHPVRVTVAKPKVERISADYGKETGKILSAIKGIDPGALKSRLSSGPVEVDGLIIRSEYVEFLEKEETLSGERFVPHVAEPSFGADRLTYLALECAYTEREDRVVLKLPPSIAPVQVSVFPLVNRDGIWEKAFSIHDLVRRAGMISEFDDSGSIGRRYARADEIGCPFAVTVDYQTMADDTVTVRDRDSWEQTRVPVNGLKEFLWSRLAPLRFIT